MKIGILQTGHAPDGLLEQVGDYSELFQNMLAGRGFTFETFNVVDGEFPPGADVAEGWLITGSKHGAYEDHDWIPPLEALIRDIRDADLPMVGICFGHQIIAQALGGKVEKFKGGWSVGRTEYRVGEKVYNLNAWHQDQVVDLPPDATVLGESSVCENAVIAYGDRIWTIQPHPEFGADFIEGLIEGRGKGVVPDALLERARAGLSAPTDNSDIARQMADIFEKARA